MKISKFTMVLFLTLSLALFSFSFAKKHSKKSKINAETTSANEGPKKKFIKTQRNSLGFEVKADTVITQYPFKVERCDQIVLFKGKLIPDHEDYTKRREAVFTITAYHVNVFSEKNPDKLIQSVLFKDGKTSAQVPRGARGCIRVDSGKHLHPLILCGDDEKNGNAILKAVNKFSECRGGLLEKKDEIDISLLKKLLRACGMNCGFTDPKKLKAKIEQLKKKLKSKQNHLKNANGFFHPGFNGVPGTDA